MELRPCPCRLGRKWEMKRHTKTNENRGTILRTGDQQRRCLGQERLAGEATGSEKRRNPAAEGGALWPQAAELVCCGG